MISSTCNHQFYAINLLQINADRPIAFVGEGGSGWHSNSAHDFFGTDLLVLIDSKTSAGLEEFVLAQFFQFNLERPAIWVNTNGVLLS